MIIFKQFGSMLGAQALPADEETVVRLTPAGGIYDNLDDAEQYVTILDSACNPTKKEIIKISGFQNDGVTANIIERGSQGTSPQNWASGAVYRSLLTDADVAALSTGTGGGGGGGDTGIAPVITAGATRTILSPEGGVITPDGAFSSVSESGTAPVSYQWERLSGPSSLTINNATLENPSITVPPVAGDYVLRFTAANDYGSDVQDFKITVQEADNRDPTGTPSVSVSGAALATVDVSGVTDPDGALTWSIEFVPGGATVTSAPYRYQYTSRGTYPITATANDGKGGTKVFTLQAEITPGMVTPSIAGAATANVGVGGAYQVGFEYTDPNQDALTYEWTHTSGLGSIADLNSATVANPVISSGTIVGTKTFQVTATDPYGNQAQRNLVVNVTAVSTIADSMAWEVSNLYSDGLTIRLDVLSTADSTLPSGEIQAVRDWGDGRTDTGVADVYGGKAHWSKEDGDTFGYRIYSVPGQYNIVDTFTYTDGSQDVLVTPFTAVEKVTEPTVTFANDFVALTEDASTLNTADLGIYTTGNPATDPISYQWTATPDAGDPAAAFSDATVEKPIITFVKPTQQYASYSYTLRLTVTSDSTGLAVWKEAVVRVDAPTPKIADDVTWELLGTAGGNLSWQVQIQTTDATVLPDSTMTVSRAWGDGSTDFGSPIRSTTGRAYWTKADGVDGGYHAYANAGTYNVTDTITYSDGSTDQFVTQIVATEAVVGQPPTAEITYADYDSSNDYVLVVFNVSDAENDPADYELKVDGASVNVTGTVPASNNNGRAITGVAPGTHEISLWIAPVGGTLVQADAANVTVPGAGAVPTIELGTPVVNP